MFLYDRIIKNIVRIIFVFNLTDEYTFKSLGEMIEKTKENNNSYESVICEINLI